VNLENTSDVWNALTPVQRVVYCRENGREAEKLAQAAHPNHRHLYLSIAAQWNELAAELEK
jgi:hypothetical protein